MILDGKTEDKPKIDYPTNWKFKIIGRDKQKVQDAIKKVMGKKEHTCSFSKTSNGGKFHSYSAECQVESQEDRDEIYKELQKSDDIDYLF